MLGADEEPAAQLAFQILNASGHGGWLESSTLAAFVKLLYLAT